MILLFFICAALSVYASYQDAGVSIDAGDELVRRIAPFAKATARKGADATLGGFSGIFDLAKTGYQDPLLLSTTDGVGTKLKLASVLAQHDTIGIDLVAMCVNDLLVHGAEPVVFLDYFATGKLNIDQAETIIKSIAAGCSIAGCALSGGETAEMPGMYQADDYDLAGFALGLVEREELLPKGAHIQPGDVVIGLASSGIHSNGYSFVRYIVEKNNIDLHAQPPFKSTKATLGEVLLEPTTIYVPTVLPLVKAGYISALAHITGGGLVGNIPRVLPADCAVVLDMQQWEVLPVFTWLAQVGHIYASEMLKTFNLGIGMIALVKPEYVTIVQEQLIQQGQKSYVIGTVIRREHEEQVIIKNNIFSEE